MNSELADNSVTPHPLQGDKLAVPESPGYSTLKELVNSGQLELLYIVSPPRCLSTALEIALTETADGQIHEPFHPGRSENFDEGCQQIVDRFRQLHSESQGKTPMRLVVKDLIRQVELSDWVQLLDLAQEVIFTIREPTVQLYSLIKRRANDMREFNSDTLTDEEIVVRIPEIPIQRITDDSWQRLGDLWLRNQDRAVVISQLSFLNDPRSAIDRLRGFFGWTTPADNILSGWTQGAGPNFYSPGIKYHPGKRVFSYGGGWLREAFNSRSFQPLDPEDDKPRPVSLYPEPIKIYLLEEMLPVYVRMMMHPSNLSRPSFEDLIKNPKLVTINPIEAYVICQSYKDLPDDQEVERQLLLKQLEGRILTEHPEIADELSKLFPQE